jgi:hypothetical protein
MSQYVGAVDVHGSPFAGTTYTPIQAGPMSFSLTGDEDGKFKSLAVQSGLSVFQKNLIKGWAAQLQGSILQNAISAENFSDKISSSSYGQSSTQNNTHNFCSVINCNLGFYGILNPCRVIITDLNLTKCRFYP